MWKDQELLDKLERSFEIQVDKDLPDFLKDAFSIPHDLQINTNDGVFNPVKEISFHGTCQTSQFLDCPNTPDYHLDTVKDPDLGPDYLDEVCMYYWFDFVACGPDKTSIPLRAVLNSGSADSNDSLWGAVWARTNGELIANIKNSGEDLTTIEVVSNEVASRFQSQQIEALARLNDDFESINLADCQLIPVSMEYSNDLAIEKIIDLSIRLFSALVYRGYHQLAE
ncbi:MAG: hypothetical protein K2Z81_24745 [Cyanobacteria bacterium]|nr:hypothetical protein [Cyanobacteriota bacterium]